MDDLKDLKKTKSSFFFKYAKSHKSEGLGEMVIVFLLEALYEWL